MNSKNKDIKTVEHFFKKIDEEALEYCKVYSGGSIVDYLSDLIHVTTYDTYLDIMFIRIFNQSVTAILESKHEVLLQDNIKYKDYITSLNMEFFADAIEWGSSIRYSWFWANKHRPYKAFGSTHREDIDYITETDELINFFTAFSMYATQVLEAIDKTNQD